MRIISLSLQATIEFTLRWNVSMGINVLFALMLWIYWMICSTSRVWRVACTPLKAYLSTFTRSAIKQQNFKWLNISLLILLRPPVLIFEVGAPAKERSSAHCRLPRRKWTRSSFRSCSPSTVRHVHFYSWLWEKLICPLQVSHKSTIQCSEIHWLWRYYDNLPSIYWQIGEAIDFCFFLFFFL